MLPAVRTRLARVRHISPSYRLPSSPLHQSSEELPYDDGHGEESDSGSTPSERFLFLTVSHAEGLMAMDSNGKSDPFCVIHIGEKKHKTSTKMKTLNPVWNETFTFRSKDVDKANGLVEFELFDKDQWTKDDFLGNASINVCSHLQQDEEPETFELKLTLPGTWKRLSQNRRNQKKDIGHVSVTMWWSKSQISTDVTCTASMLRLSQLQTGDHRGCSEANREAFKVKKTNVCPSEDHPKSLPSIVHCSRGSVFEEPVAAVLILKISQVELTVNPCMPTNTHCPTKCIFKCTGLAAKKHMSRVLGNIVNHRSVQPAMQIFSQTARSHTTVSESSEFTDSGSLSHTNSFFNNLLNEESSDDEAEVLSIDGDSADDSAPTIAEIDVKKETKWFYEIKMFDQKRVSEPMRYVVNSGLKVDFEDHAMFVVQLPLPNIDVEIAICKKSENKRSPISLPFTVSLFDIMDADDGVTANTDNGSMVINYRLICLDDRPRLMHIRHKLDFDEQRFSATRMISNATDLETDDVICTSSTPDLTRRISYADEQLADPDRDPGIVVGGLSVFLDEIEMPNLKSNIHGCFCILKCQHHWAMTSTLPTDSALSWRWLLQLPIYDPATVISLTVFGISARHPTGTRLGKLRVRLSTLQPEGRYPCYLPFMSDGVEAGRAKLKLKVSYPSEVNLIKSYVKSAYQKEIYDYHLAQGSAKSLIRKEQRKLIIQWLDTSSPRISKQVSRHVLDLEKETFSRKRFAMHIRRLQHCFAFMGPMVRKIRSLQAWENSWESMAFCLGIWIAGWNFVATVVVCLFLLFWMISLYYSVPAAPPTMADPVLLPPGSADTAAERSERQTEHTNPYATLRSRYDQIQSTLIKIQKILDSIASFCERIHALLTWRDPVATRLLTVGVLAVMFLVSALGLKICICFALCWSFRPPILRTTLPPPPLNFFRRLPSRSDQIL